METKKNIALFCVNYNSYNYLDGFLKSLEAAMCPCTEKVNLDVCIADNTDKNWNDITFRSSVMNVIVFPFHENLGYFGAIHKMQQETPQNYDFSILCNVDVTVEKDFFHKLANYQPTKDEGWITPAIISVEDGCDLSPQATTRYSRKKLSVLHLFYTHPFLLRLYEKTFYKIKRSKSHPASTVYAGHGSFIILTREFFNRCGLIDYPVFLYGEEIYLGEMCYRHQLAVNYYPDIVVHDTGRVSTGKMKRSHYYQCNAEAIDYLIHTFYDER